MREIVDGAYARIRTHYSAMLPTEKRIADFIIHNANRIHELSIVEIASGCDTSNATVTRFCKKLGFHGFRSFRIAAIRENQLGLFGFDSLKNIDNFDSSFMTVEQICNSNAQACLDSIFLIDEGLLSKAAQMIDSAQRIILVAQGAVSAVAVDFYHKLLRLGIACIYTPDRRFLKMQVATAGAGDLLVVCALSGNTKSTLEMMRTARENGANSIVMCNGLFSPLAKVSDLCLVGPGRMGSDITHTLAPRIALLCIVDYLFYALQRDYGAKYFDAIKNTSQAIVEDWN